MTASRTWTVYTVDGMKLCLTTDFEPSTTASHTLLAEALGREREELERDLVYGPHGKPELPGGPAFSVSHSGPYWAVLIGGEQPVGLDIQVPVAASFESIAKRFFREEEAHLLATSDEAERRDLFFRLWTEREALLKAAGMSVFRRTEALTDYEVHAPEFPERELRERLYAAYAVKRTK